MAMRFRKITSILTSITMTGTFKIGCICSKNQFFKHGKQSKSHDKLKDGKFLKHGFITNLISSSKRLSFLPMTLNFNPESSSFVAQIRLSRRPPWWGFISGLQVLNIKSILANLWNVLLPCRWWSLYAYHRVQRNCKKAWQREHQLSSGPFCVHQFACLLHNGCNWNGHWRRTYIISRIKKGTWFSSNIKSFAIPSNNHGLCRI
jgi:hypothetical protein